MYSILALTLPQERNSSPDERVRLEVQWLVPLVESLCAISPLFASLGMISGQAQGWINDRIAEHESSDDGIPEYLIAEFNRLAGSDRISILNNTQAFTDLTIAASMKMRADGYDGTRITASTGKLAVNGSLTRVLFDSPQDRGVFTIEMPMRDKGDVWFSDPAIMRDMLKAVIKNVPNTIWVCAYPSMYVGMQKSLFRDRINFGWMGYSAEYLEARGPLYTIEPAGSGTMMQLKPTMMTLHAEDIELCNEAEAFLSDMNILPLR